MKPLALIVDDEKAISRFIKVSLEAESYRCLQAQGGGEAISLIASQQPDIVLLDLGLPDIDGMDLIRRLREYTVFGVTFPLLTKSDGTKFGKSEGGNIWLDPARTSPYKFYQFWINQADSDMPRWLRLFTFMPPDEITDYERRLVEEPEKRAAQKKLAEEITAMVHGETALENAVRASEAMFGGSLKGIDEATLAEIFSEVPSTEIPRDELGKARSLVDVLVEHAVFKSKGEARRLIESGGLYLNNERLDADINMGESVICAGNIAVIRKGKKNYHLLKFV
jgi:tyrosyl-tRNA synthetase